MEKENLEKSIENVCRIDGSKIKEVDASDWQKPWFGTNFSGQAQNINGRRYNNFNQILLSFISEEKDTRYPYF